MHDGPIWAWQPKMTKLTDAVSRTYRVGCQAINAKHVFYRFVTQYDGTGFDTKREAYDMAYYKLKKENPFLAFILKMDLGDKA